MPERRVHADDPHRDRDCSERDDRSSHGCDSRSSPRAAPHQPKPGTVNDEAMRAKRTAPSFPAADEDYFHDMDGA